LWIDAGRFTVRLAETDEDGAAAQRLRYKGFVEEMNANASAEDTALRRERDEFDAYFDHLILIDNEAEHQDPLDYVAGVYRLLRGEVAARAKGFYGESEYDLTKIKDYPRPTMELGRSCVGVDYRGGAAMHLLWTGLGNYVAEHDIEIMFGVASFHGTDVQELAQPLSMLHHNHLAPPDLRVRAQPSVFQTMDLVAPDGLDRRRAMVQVPALIKAYLRLGGFVGEGAFIDHTFNTTDVCLILDTTRMNERQKRIYGGA